MGLLKWLLIGSGNLYDPAFAMLCESGDDDDDDCET